ncbi:carbonic anhydrase [Trichoderma sp. TUCIM 5745]
MAEPLTVEELLRRNELKKREPTLSLQEWADLPPEQRPQMCKIFIVSCCDPRINAWEIFGLEKWEANVVRTCAGRVKSQVENIIFLDNILHFSDLMILHHTDCSAGIFSNDSVREVLKERAPEHGESIDAIDLPGYETLQHSTQYDVDLIRNSPLIRKELRDRTHGFVYDIETGRVTKVTS